MTNTLTQVGILETSGIILLDVLQSRRRQFELPLAQVMGFELGENATGLGCIMLPTIDPLTLKSLKLKD